MNGFLYFIVHLANTLMGGCCIADAAKYFSEKKWGLFGFNTILAINFVAWMIKYIFTS